MAPETTARLEARLPSSVYEGFIRLSAEDQRRFAEALFKAPAPNAALRKAKRRHATDVEVR